MTPPPPSGLNHYLVPYFLGLKAFPPQILPIANSLIPVLTLAPPS